MRLLCQRVAQRANHEDEETGWFFQDRFKATRLSDEASLLACAAYVDLNPIRAAICETLEESDHTSVQFRIEALREEQEAASKEAACHGPQQDCWPETPAVEKLRHRRDSFLAMSLADYLELLDWTARQVAPGKTGKTPAGVPPVVQRLGLDRASWCDLVSDFRKLFCTVAGSPEFVDSMRSHRTHRHFHLRRRARELFAIAD